MAGMGRGQQEAPTRPSPQDEVLGVAMTQIWREVSGSGKVWKLQTLWG